MNERYLYRGKRKDNGEWVTGYLIKGNNTYIVTPESIYYMVVSISYIASVEFVEVLPETIGQCTGLRDKNGKLIFEGDVVKYQFDNDDCPFPNKRTDKIIGKIFFSSWRASFSVTAGKNLSDILNNDLFRYVRNGNRVDVIGNIHDNPELLEVEK